LSNYPTKQDLRDEILASETRSDMKFDVFQGKIEEILLKFRSDILNYIDKFAGEIKDNREERAISGKQLSSNTQRIEKLEKKVFGSVQAN